MSFVSDDLLHDEVNRRAIMANCEGIAEEADGTLAYFKTRTGQIVR